MNKFQKTVIVTATTGLALAGATGTASASVSSCKTITGQEVALPQYFCQGMQVRPVTDGRPMDPNDIVTCVNELVNARLAGSKAAPLVYVTGSVVCVLTFVF